MTVLSLSPLAIARTLGGEACGNSVHVPGAGHSRRDRSLHITVDPAAPDGFVVCDHAGERSRAKDIAAKDFVREALGLPFGRRAPRRPLTAPAASHGRSEASRLDHRERTARAFALWPKSRPPAGTPVEAYLLRRDLTLPDRAEEAIRFHGYCPFAGKRTPAMVALVTDIITNKPKAVHRTAITISGEKVKIDGKDRLALGPIGGGAVKITPDADVTLALGIGEGIESTLSLCELPEFGASPIWALLSAGGVAAFPVLAGIEALWIAVDHDQAGEKAARACAERWQTAGREVFLVRPVAERADLNDVAMKKGRRHGSR